MCQRIKLVQAHMYPGQSQYKQDSHQKGAVHRSHVCLVPSWVPSMGPTQEGEPACDLTPVPKVASAYRQPRSVGQQVLFWHLYTIHDDHARGRGPQGELALNLGGCKAPHPLLQQKAPNAVIFTPSPHYKQVGHRRVGDPGGRTGSKDLAAILLPRPPTCSTQDPYQVLAPLRV